MNIYKNFKSIRVDVLLCRVFDFVLYIYVYIGLKNLFLWIHTPYKFFEIF